MFTLLALELEEFTVSNQPYLKVYSGGDLSCVANLKIGPWSHMHGYSDYDDMNTKLLPHSALQVHPMCLVERLEIPQVRVYMHDNICHDSGLQTRRKLIKHYKGRTKCKPARPYKSLFDCPLERAVRFFDASSVTYSYLNY
jgi:hypothetical protein